ADLSRTNFVHTNLSNVDFTKAEIGWTTFGAVDLSYAKGLDKIHHCGPSTVGIDTAYLSKGNIPEVFLRGTGAPNDFISFVKSLVTQPLQFYSCFISYSSKDQIFAERLHADLQNEGVRCWFAPDDLKIGDKILSNIDESIRKHDKFLLILSQ